MDFTQLMSMLSPRPDMDPFAIGNALASNPEQMAPQLATMGPPPPEGQGFGDWLQQKLQSPMPQGGGGIDQAPGVGPVPNTLPGVSSPTSVSPLIAAGAPMGVENVPGVGPVPTMAEGGTPPPAEGITPPNRAIREAREKEASMGGGRKPEILSGGGDERSVPQAGSETDPEKMKKMQAALKGMGGLLQGVKAPPAPETQKISSPSAPRPGQMGPSQLIALMQQLQGGAPAAQPLRLGNALYAGGRGLY